MAALLAQQHLPCPLRGIGRLSKRCLQNVAKQPEISCFAQNPRYIYYNIRIIIHQIKQLVDNS